MTCIFENKLAIESKWLIDENIISIATYKRYQSANKINQLQLGGNGRKSLIEYASLPEKYRQKVEAKIGDPRSINKYSHFRSFLEQDREAISFFGNYKLQDYRFLPTETAKEYCTNAMFLNAIHKNYTNTVSYRKSKGGSKNGVWAHIVNIVSELKDEYQHTLPTNQLRLKDKLKSYQKEGYTALIHRNFGNNNSRKVNEQLERLILSIYTLNNKPFANMVQSMYLEFLAGKFDFVDIQTGEIFNKLDFFNDKGQPITISEATVWNYINDPKNRAIVDSLRNDAHSFNNMHRPHHHRTKPNYSLSKISLDDRDLPRKMLDGKRVKAYYAYDVTSGILLGASYSKTKDTDLFVACIRNMFRFLKRNELGFPLEVEVEHHLVNQFKDDLMKAGVVFPFVRFCNPGNSQEKRAEHFNKAKKYGYEKRYQDGIGRYSLSLEANRPKLYKEWNEQGMQVVEKRFEYDQLIADDLWITEKYNNDLHPDQKRYPKMTRMDVFRMNLNPDAIKYDSALAARHIGDKVTTSIMRNQYLHIKQVKFTLPNIDVLSKLAPNNYTVDAYYIPEENGTINEVYIYQNDNYIAECKPLGKYNEASAEQTQNDFEAYTEQSKYVSQFDAFIKKGRKEKVTKLEIIKTDVKPVEVEVHIPKVEQVDWASYVEDDSTIAQRAWDEI